MSKTKKAAPGQGFGQLFSFMLVALFAVLALLLTVIGVQAYQGVVNASEHNNDVRASLSYVQNKVRAADVAGGVELAQREGLPGLLLRGGAEGDADGAAQTFIYFYDGWLLEAYATPAAGFTPGDGQPLVALERVEFAQEQPGLLRLTLTTRDGETYQAHIAQRTGRAGEEDT